MWIPFLTGNYGRMGLSCEIVTINSTTCEQAIKGLIMYLVFWSIPLYLTFIVGGLGYIYYGNYGDQRKDIQQS